VDVIVMWRYSPVMPMIPRMRTKTDAPPDAASTVVRYAGSISGFLSASPAMVSGATSTRMTTLSALKAIDAISRIHSSFVDATLRHSDFMSASSPPFTVSLPGFRRP